MLNGTRREMAQTRRGRCAGMWRQARQLLALAIVAGIVSGSLLIRVQAAPGALDTTFSSDGRQITDFFVSSDIAFGIAVQSDGKIVAGGTAVHDIPDDFDDYDFAVARYSSTGTLDTTFSSDGKQTTDFAGSYDVAHDMAIQPDGKIVLVGETHPGGSFSPNIANFAVARYNSNGTLDTTFSSDGKQTTDFSGKGDVARGVAIQPNGKIVVVGEATGSSSTSTDFAVARYNSNGTLDTTFSTDGKQTTDFSADDDNAYAVAIQSNNKIVVVGYTRCCGSRYFALARYNGNGSLDATFNGDGKQTTDPGGVSHAHAVAIQSDGKIVVAGSVLDSGIDYNFALVRYNVNGSLDDGSANDSTSRDSFGTNGIATTDFFGSIDTAAAVAIQSNGKIVAAGGARNSSNTHSDVALARYTSNGKPDTTFSTDGKVNTGFFNNSDDSASGIAIQTNGKIVIAGSVKSNGSKHNFALARYTGD